MSGTRRRLQSIRRNLRDLRGHVDPELAQLAFALCLWCGVEPDDAEAPLWHQALERASLVCAMANTVPGPDSQAPGEYPGSRLDAIASASLTAAEREKLEPRKGDRFWKAFGKVRQRVLDDVVARWERIAGADVRLGGVNGLAAALEEVELEVGIATRRHHPFAGSNLSPVLRDAPAVAAEVSRPAGW